jgi:predicted O-methyltransferase YrrM
MVVKELRTEPWLTEGAIKFLEATIGPASRVLEYGSGASTLWFASRVAELVSVEGNQAWYDRIAAMLENNSGVQLIHHEGYVGAEATFPDDYFDLVLVDGRKRVACFKAADRVLKPGGYMMLDNSERPRYSPCFYFYETKQRWSDNQLQPDKFGFTYEGWRTSWWQK